VFIMHDFLYNHPLAATIKDIDSSGYHSLTD